MGHLVVGVHVEMVIVDAHGGARLVHEVDHALGHAVELFGLDAAVTCGVDDLVVRVARRHFKVEAGVEGGDAVVVGAPIAHDDASYPHSSRSTSVSSQRFCAECTPLMRL